MNQVRTKVLFACREPRSSNQIAEMTGIDVIYVRTILREFRDQNIITAYRQKAAPSRTGYMYKLKRTDVLDGLDKKHEPRPLMQVLGVWI